MCGHFIRDKLYKRKYAEMYINLLHALIMRMAIATIFD